MEPVERLTTGNPELDLILGGGFPVNSINILMGEPGSGKTILAEHLVFANATENARPVLYLTTLSEPLGKIVRYLQQFAFFDEDKLASGAVVYDSIGDELAQGGVNVIVPKLKEMITTLSPKIIVIDSFKAIHDLSTSVPEMRRMLYELAGLLTAYETTAFLIGEYGQNDMPNRPEFAVADGIVELARHKLSTRDERFLRVLKLRGSSYLEGLHGFQVTPRGLNVFPRLVSPTEVSTYKESPVRVVTGITGLDTLLGGGLISGTTTIIAGPTGSGKTTVGLQFVAEGIRRGEPSLYINFQENPTQLRRQMTTMGVTAEAAEKLHLLYASPVELQIDSIIVRTFEMVQKMKIRRVVIDALGDLAMAASDQQRLHAYLYALVQHFAVSGVTTLLTYEVTNTLVAERRDPGRFSALCDAFVMLDIEFDSRAHRTLRIAKARSLSHDLNAHAMTISKAGVEVDIGTG